MAKTVDMLKRYAKSPTVIVLAITLSIIMYGIEYNVPLFLVSLYAIILNSIALLSFFIYHKIRDHFREKEYQRRLREIERRITLFKAEKEKALAEKQRIEAELEAARVRLMNKALPERVRRFFEVLEKRGIMKLKDVEMKVLTSSKRAVIILETKEALLDKPLLKAMAEFFSSMGLEFKGGTLFRNFVHYELRNRDYVSRCVRLDIPGTSSFLLTIKGRVENFAEKVVEEYKDYVHSVIKEFTHSKQYLILPEESKKKLKKWYTEVFYPPIKPKIIVTTPYQTNVYSILRLVGEKYEADCVNMLRYEIKNILNQLINVWKIKIAYLFEAAGYNVDVVKAVENLENNINKKLKVKRFTEFLSLQDPYNSLITTIEAIDKELFENIKRYEGNLKELKDTIMDLKHILF